MTKPTLVAKLLNQPKRGLSALLTGEPGGGKTKTAGSLRDPKYLPWKLWNTDRPDGADCLEVPSGCEIVDLSGRLFDDPDCLVKAVDAELVPSQPAFRTYILDSISFLQTFGEVMPKVLQAGSYSKVGFAGWGDIYISGMTTLLKLRVLQSRGANIVVTCHVMPGEDPMAQKGADGSRDTIMKPALSGKLQAFLGGNFSLIGYMRADPALTPQSRPTYKLYTGPVGRIQAKNSYELPLVYVNPVLDKVFDDMNTARMK